MLALNFPQGTTPLIPTFPTYLQLGEPYQENPFGRQYLYIQDRVKVQRAETFIKLLEENLSNQEGIKSPLQAFLGHLVQLPYSDKTTPVFAEVSQSFFKQKGYFSRLFSQETWKEWTENRTSLGQVVFQFSNCIGSRAPVSSFMEGKNQQLIQKANEEVIFLLKDLASHEVARISKSSCFYGLIGGITASILFKNPLPLLLGMSKCFPRAHAQQKVGSEFLANTYTSDNQRLPSVASFNNGNFVITWTSCCQDGSLDGVFGQLFDGNGNKIGSEFRVNSYTFTNQWYPSVASFSNGNFVVTWQSSGQEGLGNYGVYGQLFDENTTKIGNEFHVNTYTDSFQERPSVATFSNGNFVVTWQSWGQIIPSYEIFGQLFDDNTTKISNEFQINTYTNNSQEMPSVTRLNNDNFVVTWQSWGQVTASYEIFGQLFDGNATKIGNEFQVNTYTNNSQKLSSIASFSNNNFVVTWESFGQDGSGSGVYGQLFDGNSTKIGSEFRANTYTTDYQVFSSVASFNNDNFVVTWQSDVQDSNESVICGQLFSGSRTKIGIEFRVNNFTADNQPRLSVASLSNGNFVVIYASVVQTWWTQDIFGQIFDDFPLSSTTTSSSTTTTTSSTTFTSSTAPNSKTTTNSLTATSSTTFASSTAPNSKTTTNSLAATLTTHINQTGTISINHPPVLEHPIPDRIIEANEVFELFLDEDTFVDEDGDSLSYSAMLKNGQPLPEWLTFDEKVLHFLGTPKKKDVGMITVEVEANDSKAATHDEFDIQVEKPQINLLESIGIIVGIVVAAFSVIGGIYRYRQKVFGFGKDSLEMSVEQSTD